MLKTTENTRSAANPKKTKDKANDNNVVCDSIVGGGEATTQAKSIKRNNQSKTTKSKILVKSKNDYFSPKSKTKKAETGFFTPKARLAFT